MIGGYTAPRGARTGFGALLVGYFDEGRLRYAGKVGTGFDQATLDELRDKLEAARREPRRSPRRRDSGAGRDWVRPELVAEIGFTEWTARRAAPPSAVPGLRDDKAAREVVRES